MRAGAPFRPRRGHDRLAWAGPLVGATFLAGLGGGVARSDHPYPRPGASADEITRYFTQPSRAPRVSAAGQVLSAASLAAWTARVARLAAGDRPARAAALAGGAISTAALATSAACTALLTSTQDPERAVRLHRAAFVAGGPTHGAGFGLLLAASAVAGRRDRRVPPALARAALAAATPNLLAPAYLRSPRAVWLIPAGRFSGLIVTAATGARLARA
jgi:hypothetical protein